MNVLNHVCSMQVELLAKSFIAYESTDRIRVEYLWTHHCSPCFVLQYLVYVLAGQVCTSAY